MDSRAQEQADRLIDFAEGILSGAHSADERRSRQRVPYSAMVALILLGPDGYRSEPILLRARDLSGDGICVTGRNMIHVGSAGAMQLVRSDGRAALLGVQVMHCRYVGKMIHHTGMRFTDLPIGLSRLDFVDKHGRMKILIPKHEYERSP
jgi:hypothetical protein